jgi:cytochrome bd-type quinol oxidase subunit 2
MNPKLKATCITALVFCLGTMLVILTNEKEFNKFFPGYPNIIFLIFPVTVIIGSSLAFRSEKTDTKENYAVLVIVSQFVFFIYMLAMAK